MFKSRRNTLEKGQIRFIIFSEGGTWYGVALEFNIVVHAESKFEASLELDRAVKNYLITARSAKLRDPVLNQETSQEYSKLWNDLQAGREPKLKKITEEDTSDRETIQVASYGFIPQVA